MTERRATESATEREARLARRRVRDRASDSLEHMGRPSSTTAGQSTAQDSESTKEREARLQQLRVSQQQMIASESTEEREAHSQQVRVCQQQRSVSESTEEREALQQVRVSVSAAAEC